MSSSTTPFPPPTVGETNPFVGPRPMRRGETIHGRTSEIAKIRGLLVSNRVLLLYSPSGAGKTSLIEAGLLPQLEQRDFVVFPPIRVGYELGSATQVDTNRYCASVIASLEERRGRDEPLPLEAAASKDLGVYLSEIADEVPEGRLCLVFDQFEEVFTLNPADVAAKKEFFEQLGAALRNRRFWVLFAMREDFIAQLDPYLDDLPTQLRTTFRLGLLGDVAAMDAARATAKEHEVDFEETAARKLADDLRTVQVDHPAGPVKEKGPHVEPLQLQVVCRRLWDRPRPDANKITEGDVTAGGGVNQALSSYYNDEVAKVDDQTQANEREIRRWFDDELITDDGFRKPVRRGPDADGPQVLEHLAQAHLIRRERRSGADWYELTHDRFVEPIRESNRKFDEEERRKVEDAKRRLEEKRQTLLRRIMAIGLVVAVLAGIVVAAVINNTKSDAATLTAESIELPTDQFEITVEPGGISRFLINPDEGDIIEVTLTAPGIPTSAELRLVRVVNGELGAELASDSLRVIGADAEKNQTQTPGAQAGDTSSSASAAAIQRAVTDQDMPVVVEVSSQPGGNFQLEIEKVDQGSSDATVIPKLGNKPLNGTIETAGAVARYTVAADDDDGVVRMVVSPADRSENGFDPILTLDGGDESVVQDNRGVDQAEVLVKPLTPDTEYVVEVSGYEGSTGEFTVSAERVTATPLQLGAPPLDGQVDAEGFATYTVIDPDGGDVRVVVSPIDDTESGLDSVVTLRQDDGAEVASSDGSFAGTAEVLVGNLTPDTEYMIEVSGYLGSTGDFTVSVERISPVPLELDAEPVEGMISNDANMTTYAVTIPYDVEIGSVRVVPDPELDVRFDISTEYWDISIDDHPIGEPEMIDLAELGIGEVPNEDRWLVTVWSFDGSVGGFKISVTTAR